MKSRHWISPDIAMLVFSPILLLAISLLTGLSYPIVTCLRHPSALAWLWALGVATSTSFIGIMFLFFAKLPQYRAGILLRVGCQHLPSRQQRLYRLSFWLIVPSIVVLLGLLSAAQHFQ